MADGEARERDETRSEETGDTNGSQTSGYDPHGESTSDSEKTSSEKDDEPKRDNGDREHERRQKDTPDEEETREPQTTEARADDEDEDEDEDDEERKEPPGPGRAFLLFIATGVFLFLGFLFFSALIAPTYIAALILAALWFVAAYFLLGRFTRNRRHIRFPVRLAFGVTVAAFLIWIVVSSVTSNTVKEPLVTGQKVSETKPTARVPEKPQKPPPAHNVLLATGAFSSAGAGSASGQASFVQLPNQQVKVTIKGLDVTPGPTLHVFLAKNDGKNVSAHKDLGSLRGNKGDLQYTIPAGTDTRQYKTVVIWCKFLGVPFARAETKQQ